MQIRRPLKRSCLKADVKKKEERGGSNDMYAVRVQLFFQGTFTVKLYQRYFLFSNLQNNCSEFYVFLYIQTQNPTDSYPSYSLQFNMQGVTEKVFEITFLFPFSLPISLQLWWLGRFCGRSLSKYKKIICSFFKI